MKLTPHFTLAEMTVSAAAKAAFIANTPNAKELEQIKETAWRMEIVRVLTGGKPIYVNSCFRSERVNRLVNGSPTSDHRKGVAVDFTIKGLTIKQTADIISASALDYDQLILYKGHLHIGFGSRMRRHRFNS
jgi:zinc D-Ala-D-Ala carboxypeptidase